MTLAFDLDPTAYGRKIKQSHYLAMGNAPTKFQKLRFIPFQVIYRRRILHYLALWPWPLTFWHKIQQVSSHGQSFYNVSQTNAYSFWSHCSDKDHTQNVTVTLAFDPMTLKSIEVICLSCAMAYQVSQT